jgi:hypothetical protein
MARFGSLFCFRDSDRIGAEPYAFANGREVIAPAGLPRVRVLAMCRMKGDVRRMIEQMIAAFGCEPRRLAGRWRLWRNVERRRRLTHTVQVLWERRSADWTNRLIAELFGDGAGCMLL